ncbi:hypothetical protein CEXT_715431 [Caerostris extrusa]|uniref:Uncharacterized protein n=1 Tax=Caerostris extrusa TaxID=172846 RepID=A0AAV4X0Y5_CAEEX|nr:hypothetical protein CEXT_715431 [Caerostris extrusa]
MRPTRDEEEKEKKASSVHSLQEMKTPHVGFSNALSVMENHPSYANRNWKDLPGDLAKDFGPSYFFLLAVHPSFLQKIPVCFNTLKCFDVRRWVSACRV